MHPSKILSDDAASSKDCYSSTAKKSDAHAPVVQASLSQSLGHKGSKLTKVLSGIDRHQNATVNPSLSLKDTVARKATHLSATPQIQYMGKRN